jgi:hypothetical protein
MGVIIPTFVLVDSAFERNVLERWHPCAGNAGLSTTGAFTAVEGEPPYVRISEFESIEALKDACQAGGVGSTSADVLGIPPVQRQVYRSRGENFAQTNAVIGSRTYVVASIMSVRQDREDDLNAWYLQEHIPGLLEIDGWLRSRRFERVAGVGPKHLALHDLLDLEVRKHPKFHEIMATSWRRRLVDVRTAYDRRLLRVEDQT